MPKETNPIQGCIGPFLQPQGYQRKGSSWYFDAPEAILVVNLQKSQWGRQYYVNLAVWLKALGDAVSPKENHCHIRSRLAGAKTEQALDLSDTSLTDELRQKALLSALKRRGLPLLHSCSTVQGVKTMLRVGKLDDALVTKSVLALTGSK